MSNIHTISPVSDAMQNSSQWTLATVIDLIEDDQTLSARDRQAMASALRTTARAWGAAPEFVPANPATLRQLSKGFGPSMIGVSNSTWRNTRSLADRALRHVGLGLMPGRYTTALGSEWQDLMGRLNDRRARHGISRFFHYCTVQGIAPAEVDDAVMTQFLQAMEGSGTPEKPKNVRANTCRAWNHGVVTDVGWPGGLLTIPILRKSYALPWDGFPMTLKQDVETYLHRSEVVDLSDDFALRPLSKASIETRTLQLRGFASALVHNGYDPATLRTLADLVTLSAFKDGLAFHLKRAGDKPTLGIFQIAHVLTTVARHWVCLPQAEVDQLKLVCKKLDPGPRRMTEKNRKRLRQLDDPQAVSDLINLPAVIFAEREKAMTHPYLALLDVQVALALELLLVVPIRIGNLVRLEVARHFVRERGGLRLSIPASEVKNAVEIQADLPKTFIRLFDSYLKDYRPMLLDAGNSAWLFPGRGGAAKGVAAFRGSISGCLMRHCGLAMNPHLLRHAASKLYLAARPGDLETVRQLNGHRSIETTRAFYAGSDMPAAAARYSEVIAGLRSEGSNSRATPTRKSSRKKRS